MNKMSESTLEMTMRGKKVMRGAPPRDRARGSGGVGGVEG